MKNKKEEIPPLPYIRGVIDWTETSKLKGIEDDTNKVIKIIEGNKVVREYPYNECLVENIEKIQGIPIDDLTLEPEEIQILEEMNPTELKFSK